MAAFFAARRYLLRMTTRLIASLALLAVCCKPVPVAPLPEQAPNVYAVDELKFFDPDLESIAQLRRDQARFRHLASSRGETRVDALIALEASMNATPMAQERFNVLLDRALHGDGGRWSAVRRRAAARAAAHDDAEPRIHELLEEWRRRRTRVVAADMSDPDLWYRHDEARWEIEFHRFLSTRPRHAATWGWLVAAAYPDDVRRQYGRVDAERAYDYYVSVTGLGTATEARELYSIPGIAITAAPRM